MSSGKATLNYNEGFGNMRHKVCVFIAIVGAFLFVAQTAGAAPADSPTDTQTVTIDGFQLPAQRPTNCDPQYDDLSCAWGAVWGLPDTLSNDDRKAIVNQLIKLWSDNSKSSNTDNEIVDNKTDEPEAKDATDTTPVKDEEKAPAPSTSTNVDNTVPTTAAPAPAPATEVTDPKTPATPTTTEPTDNTCKPWNLEFIADSEGSFSFKNNTDCIGPIAVGAYDKHVPTLDIVFPQDLSDNGKWFGNIGPFQTVTGKVTYPCNVQADGITGHDLPNHLDDRYFGPNGTIIGAYHFIKECTPPVLKTAACNSLTTNSTSPKLGEMMHLTLDATNVVAVQLVHNGQDIIPVDPSVMTIDFPAIAGAHQFTASVQGEDGQWMTSASCQVSYTTVPPVQIPVCRNNGDGSYSIITVDQDKVNTTTDSDVNSPSCHPTPVQVCRNNGDGSYSIITVDQSKVNTATDSDVNSPSCHPITVKCTPTAGQDTNCLPFTGAAHTIAIAILGFLFLAFGFSLVSLSYRLKGYTLRQQYVIVTGTSIAVIRSLVIWFFSEGSYRRSSFAHLS